MTGYRKSPRTFFLGLGRARLAERARLPELELAGRRAAGCGAARLSLFGNSDGAKLMVRGPLGHAVHPQHRPASVRLHWIR